MVFRVKTENTQIFFSLCSIWVINGIYQFKVGGERNLLADNILREICGHAAFGPWKLTGSALLDYSSIGREWVDKDHRYHVIGLEKSCLLNGPAFHARLSKLGVEVPEQLRDEVRSEKVYFKFESGINISGIPYSLRNDDNESWITLHADNKVFGLIVNRKNRKSYLLNCSPNNTSKDVGSAENQRVRVYDPQRKAYLLAGRLKYEKKTFVKWRGNWTKYIRENEDHIHRYDYIFTICTPDNGR